MSTEVTEEKDVKMMSLKEPRFLSVVKKPANRISFRVVRSEDGEEKKEFAALEKRREERTKVKRNAKLLSISFPEDMSGLSEDEMEALRNHYGLTDEDYSMEKSDGRVNFVRNGEMPDASAKVNMPDGAVAEIEVPITVRSADDGDRFLSVKALRFDKNNYVNAEAVSTLLRGYEIDFTLDQIDDSDVDHVVFNRRDIEEGEELIEINLKEGFTAIVSRAHHEDVPKSLSLGVNSSAYGSYGWGQLNFASAYADIEYSEILDNSLYVLNNVLGNILFTSDMSLGDRKVLVQASLSSYGEFVSNLMDALPVQPEAQRSENVQLETDMTDKALDNAGSETQTEQVKAEDQAVEAKRDESVEDQTTETPKDDQEVIREEESTENSASSDDETNEFITRTEFKEGMDNMQKAIIDALKPQETEAKREEADTDETISDDESTETRSEEATDATESNTDDAMSKIADAMSKMVESVDTLATRMDKVEESVQSTVVVRTEDDDTVSRTEDDKADVFAGMFGSKTA